MPPEREPDEDDEDPDGFLGRWHRVIDSQHVAIELISEMLDNPKMPVRLHDGDIVIVGGCGVHRIPYDEILARASNYLCGGRMPSVRMSRLSGKGVGVQACIQVPQINGEPAPDSVVGLILGLMNDDKVFIKSGIEQDNLRRALLDLYGVHGESPITGPLSKYLDEEYGGSHDPSTGSMEWRGTHGWRWRLTYDPVGQDYQLEVLPARRKHWRELSAAVFAENIFCWDPCDILVFVGMLAGEPRGFQAPWHCLDELHERLAFHKPIRDAIAARDEEE